MKNSLWIAVVLAFAPQSVLAAAELNVVKALEVTANEGGAQVAITGSKSPTFTVFRLSSPDRIVVDLAGADVSAVRGPHDGTGPVAGIAVSQFSDENATLGRVTVSVSPDARYDVKAVGDQVLVSVNRTDAVAPPAKVKPAEPVEGAVSEAPAANTQAEPAPEESAAAIVVSDEPEPSAEQAPETAAQAASEPGMVLSRLEETQVREPGRRIRAVKASERDGKAVVSLTADGEVGTSELIELRDPPRLALDLFGFERGPRAQKMGGPLREVRFGQHPGKLRVVVEASTAEMPPYEIERTRRGLQIKLGEGKVAAGPAQAPEKSGEPAVARATPERLSVIRDVAFSGDLSKGKVLVRVQGEVNYQVTRPDPRTAVLTLDGASLPKRLERSLDTSAFGGPVKMVSSFAAPGKAGSVQIVATLDGSAEDQVARDPQGQLVWAFAGKVTEGEAQAEMSIAGARIALQEDAVAQQASGFTAEAPSYASSAGARKAKYVGRRVTFEFKDIDIHNLLRIIAEVSKRNVVVADDVKGKVTIRLRNVPWDQALDLILKTKGLGKEEMGNILRIAPAKVLEEERETAAKLKKSSEQLLPLKVRLIPVNYATAKGLSDRVKDVLSERGTMSVDDRTNVIIVKDTVEALGRAEGLVRRLDLQTPQVLIEARIVEANSTFSREFGIQWGGNVNLGPATGNPTGLLFPNVVRVVGGAGDGDNRGTADVPNFAVNMPAPLGQGAGGGVGFVFGSAGGAVALNLRLSAMEASGQMKTISSPKITTLDNNEATISSGVSIPFSQASAAGVNTTFVEAKLELKVVPHVTSDGSVLLSVNASNNQPDAGLTGENVQPSISKKEAKTQVLVKDGDTTVIGGIYTRTQGFSEGAVPVLARIPVLGWLFKKNRETDTRTELLIFITPRIINRSQAVVANDLANP